MHCLLIGNFGVGNLGDEALKEFFLTEIQDVRWTVVSASPSNVNEVPRLPGGIRSLLSLQWLKTLHAYRTCDAIVFGGGSLFTDSESVYACFLWWLHAVPGRLLGKKIHFAFQGVGPFTSSFSYWFAQSALRGGGTISVRDTYSFDRVNSMHLNIKIVQSFDPVFHLIKNKKITLRTENILILIPRKNSSDKFTNAAQNAYRSRVWKAIKILSMQQGDTTEEAFCIKLAETFQAEIVKVASIEDLLIGMADASLVISERYHGALAALALGKKLEIVSQKKEDKLSSLSIMKNSQFRSLTDSGIQLLYAALR